MLKNSGFRRGGFPAAHTMRMARRRKRMSVRGCRPELWTAGKPPLLSHPVGERRDESRLYAADIQPRGHTSSSVVVPVRGWLRSPAVINSSTPMGSSASRLCAVFSPRVRPQGCRPISSLGWSVAEPEERTHSTGMSLEEAIMPSAASGITTSSRPTSSPPHPPRVPLCSTRGYY